MKEQFNKWGSTWIGIVLSGFSFLSLSAQSTDGPKGLYKLNEIVHQDGKHVEADFKQYKYCLDNNSITLSYYEPFHKTVHSFEFKVSTSNGTPLTYTGDLSKTEDKRIQAFATSDSTFTLRWFNDRSGLDQHLFPFQTNIEELYEKVDSSDVMQQAMNLFHMKFGVKTHQLQGVWKMRGVQTKGTATSQYWVMAGRGEQYAIFGSNNAVLLMAHPNFPQAQLLCQYTPCDYLSDTMIDCDGNPMIIHWFDGATISVTRLGEDGRPFVTVWDRCGLPQNIQQAFGTDVPRMMKDVSRFIVQGFMEKYGQQPDSIQKAFETFDFAVDANERNNAVFPVLMRNGFADEYKAMKDSLLARLMRAEISAEEAVARYVCWFNKDFDRHTYCMYSPIFSKLQAEYKIDYNKHIAKYAPEPVGCKVNADTYLLRLPSCMGVVPTWEWVNKKADEFKQSGCKYLILDLRGNGGGSDGYSELFTRFFGSTGMKEDERSFFRNGYENMQELKKLCESGWSEKAHVYAEGLRIEEGNYITWAQSDAGTDRYEPLVRNGAIIIDSNSGSAGEAPVHFVRTHNGCRVKVYGKERTAGCVLSLNCNYIRLPHSNIELACPKCIYDSFEATCKDRNPGYKPDVIIPLPYPEQLTDNIDSWVLWVAKKMR